MEEILQDQIQKEKRMGTYQSVVGVQISTCRKNPKHQAVVIDQICACGSNTHMRRSSNKCPQVINVLRNIGHQNKLMSSIVQKFFHQNFRFLQKMNLKVRIMKSCYDNVTIIQLSNIEKIKLLHTYFSHLKPIFDR